MCYIRIVYLIVSPAIPINRMPNHHGYTYVIVYGGLYTVHVFVEIAVDPKTGSEIFLKKCI